MEYIIFTIKSSEKEEKISILSAIDVLHQILIDEDFKARIVIYYENYLQEFAEIIPLVDIKEFFVFLKLLISDCQKYNIISKRLNSFVLESLIRKLEKKESKFSNQIFNAVLDSIDVFLDFELSDSDYLKIQGLMKIDCDADANEYILFINSDAIDLVGSRKNNDNMFLNEFISGYLSILKLKGYCSSKYELLITLLSCFNKLQLIHNLTQRVIYLNVFINIFK